MDPVSMVHRYQRAEDAGDGEAPPAQHLPMVGALGAGAPGDQPLPAERRRDDALPPFSADNLPDAGLHLEPVEKAKLDCALVKSLHLQGLCSVVAPNGVGVAVLKFGKEAKTSVRRRRSGREELPFLQKMQKFFF